MYTIMYMYGISFRFLANIAPPARHRIPRHFGFIFFFLVALINFAVSAACQCPSLFPANHLPWSMVRDADGGW